MLYYNATDELNLGKHTHYIITENIILNQGILKAAFGEFKIALRQSKHFME